jgi:hypothetical protein
MIPVTVCAIKAETTQGPDRRATEPQDRCGTAIRQLDPEEVMAHITIDDPAAFSDHKTSPVSRRSPRISNDAVASRDPSPKSNGRAEGLRIGPSVHAPLSFAARDLDEELRARLRRRGYEWE